MPATDGLVLYNFRLLTPPDTPLFPSLDDDTPLINLVQRGRPRSQAILISRRANVCPLLHLLEKCFFDCFLEKSLWILNFIIVQPFDSSNIYLIAEREGLQDW